MTPFVYPTAPHERRHGPRGYALPESFRPWLRDEFAFRCVYCLCREAWGKVRGEFAIDHWESQSRAPERALEYDNLLFACGTCNFAKGSRPTPDPLIALISDAVAVDDNGVLVSADGKVLELIAKLDLNHPRTVEFRRLWLDVVGLASRYDPAILRRVFGYPEDLPDLRSLRPPAGNTRPEGIAASHHARRERGELPETY